MKGLLTNYVQKFSLNAPQNVSLLLSIVVIIIQALRYTLPISTGVTTCSARVYGESILFIWRGGSLAGKVKLPYHPSWSMRKVLPTRFISPSQLFQNPHEDSMEPENSNQAAGTLALKRCQMVLHLATALFPPVGINGIPENESSEPPGLPPPYKHFNGQWVPPNNPH